MFNPVRLNFKSQKKTRLYSHLRIRAAIIQLREHVILTISCLDKSGSIAGCKYLPLWCVYLKAFEHLKIASLSFF